jgi:hypothetical protein
MRKYRNRPGFDRFRIVSITSAKCRPLPCSSKKGFRLYYRYDQLQQKYNAKRAQSRSKTMACKTRKQLNAETSFDNAFAPLQSKDPAEETQTQKICPSTLVFSLSSKLPAGIWNKTL